MYLVLFNAFIINTLIITFTVPGFRYHHVISSNFYNQLGHLVMDSII